MRAASFETYVGFGDFRFYALRVARAHLVAGFGRIHWIDASAIIAAPSPALVESEAGIIEHMNDDHADALDLYASRLLGRSGNGWRMTGIDAEGCDLRREGETARLDFETHIEDAEAARRELVRLVKQARSKETT